jgi:hypothetical protein
MLRPLNLFGVRDVLHPDTPCVPREKPVIRSRWRLIDCHGCGCELAVRSSPGKYVRVTCSEACLNKVKKVNLLLGRNRYWSNPRKVEPRRLHNLRLYWQQKADDFAAQRRGAA